MTTEFDKAIVALVMALLVIIEQAWGLTIAGLSEEAVTIILAILSPILVWAIPNKSPAPPRRL